MEKTYAVFSKTGKIIESTDRDEVVNLFLSIPAVRRKGMVLASRNLPKKKHYWRAMHPGAMCQER